MAMLQTALQFSRWALEFLLVPPLLTVFIVAAISFVWAGQKQNPFRKRLWKPRHWLVLTHLLFFPAAIALAIVCASPVTNPTIPHSATRTASFLQDCLLYGSLASCGFWVWRMKGFRWFASSMIVLAELPVISALFVAGMSISGDWL